MNRDTREFLDGMMAEQQRLAARAAGFIAGYVVVASTPYVLLDIYAPEMNAAFAWASLFDWGLGYLMFLAVMNRGGLTAGGTRSGVGTYFVLGIALGIPVLLGLIALVLPGLYLLMRWLPAYSRALMTRDGAIWALGWSWQRTQPWQAPLAMAMLLSLVPTAISVLVPFADMFAYELLGRTGIILISVIGNVAASIGFAGLTVYGVAAYSMLIGHEPVRESEAEAAPDSPSPWG